MQGLRERNQNIVKHHSKRSEKEKLKGVSVPSHATSHVRTPPKRLDEPTEVAQMSARKVGLDDEEMLFLARRCLAEELMARPNVPAVLTEISTLSPVHADPVIVPLVCQPSASTSQTVVTTSVPRPIVARRNAMFQLNRLGVGLVILKFGWVWVSCGGYILADSVFCTSDICVLICRRLKQHIWQMGTRLHNASRESIRLFTETDE